MISRENYALAYDVFRTIENLNLESNKTGLYRSAILKRDFSFVRKDSEKLSSGLDPILSEWMLSDSLKLIQNEEVGMAIEELDLILELSAENSGEYWYKVGNAYEEILEYDKARKCYKRGIQFDKNSKLSIGWYYLVRTQYKQQHWGELNQILDEIMSEHPDPGLEKWPHPKWQEMYLMWGVSLQRLGRHVEAEKVFTRGLNQEISKRDWVMHFIQLYLGDYEIEHGDLISSMEHFAIAYEAAINVNEQSRRDYERRAWEKIYSNITMLKEQEINE
ncbi:Tetratricopeptide (TPR) repeat [Candidatus Methanophagaceae archaeon]|nr:Tetratricopeptide (TPR) repeat [Methanophagales archaeon]